MRGRDLWVFFALACAITWALDAPVALSWAARTDPPWWGLPLVALGAFGPTIAGALLAAREGTLREMFGRWRTRPGWILLPLALPAAIHLVGTAAYAATGGEPTQWLWPPVKPEHWVALVVFSLAEEFGWRGYAYPRAADRFGPAAGGALVGVVWGIWHLGMVFTPEGGWPDPATFAYQVAELGLWGVVLAALMERGGRSMAIAIALHAGGHLDNVNRSPADETLLWTLRLAALAAAAGVAAWSLASRPAVPSARTGAVEPNVG